jgi:protocatechuate 3,4-dioxygenase beta subunit
MDHIEEPTNEELRLMSRRSALRIMGGAGLAVLAGCASTETTTSTAATTPEGTTPVAASPAVSVTVPATITTITTADFGSDGSCVLIPEETEGPYPLDLSGDDEFLRTDITEGRPGVPLTLSLVLVDVGSGCTPVADARVDVWHCDADGVYSGFDQPGIDATGETFCRGIQLTNADGQVDFQTIYPGWYQGRITHIHFQVFLDNGLAVTSQLGFPPEVTDAVYAVEPYAAKGPNTSVPTFADDNVFSDGTQYQLAAATGDPASGYTATLAVGIALS